MKTAKKSKSPKNSKMTPSVQSHIITPQKKTLTDTPPETRQNFFNCEVKTYEDSLAYAKKIIAMALSNIAYLRALWPENFFVTRYFENMELKIIESKSHQQARILTTWILGVFHALERKYLKKFTFSIHLDPKKPEARTIKMLEIFKEVIETYEFNIEYNDKVDLEITQIRERTQKIRSNSMRFIRHLIYAAGMIKDLPAGKGFMNIRLFYYDDVTPVDYQPPGFKSSEWNELNYTDGRVELPVGKLNSSWHVLDFSVNVSKTLVKDYDEYKKAGEVVLSEARPIDDERTRDSTSWMKVDLKNARKLVTGLDESISSTFEHSVNMDESVPTADIDSMTNKVSKLDVLSNEHQNEVKQNRRTSIESDNMDGKIECECGLNEHESLTLLKCSICETKQHAICYRILVPDDKSGDEWLRNYKHYCRTCYQQLSIPKPSQIDLAIYRMDDSRVQKFCLFRRLVHYIVNTPEETGFTVTSMSQKLGLDVEIVNGLLNEVPNLKLSLGKKKGGERAIKVAKEDVMRILNEWFTRPLERKRRDNEAVKKRSLFESSFENFSNDDETSFATENADINEKSIDLNLTISDSPQNENMAFNTKLINLVARNESPKRQRTSISKIIKIDDDQLNFY